jgi:hypothetical protein
MFAWLSIAGGLVASVLIYPEVSTMRTIARFFAFTVAISCSSSLLAENFSVGDLKAFTARMDAAAARCDVNTIIDRISPLATIAGTGFAQGDMRMFRLNKSQYGQLMALKCAELTNYQYSRTNEQISIDGDQATITADVAETWVLKGQSFSTKLREKAVIELIDGKLMLVQLLANQTESNVASR